MSLIKPSLFYEKKKRGIRSIYQVDMEKNQRAYQEVWEATLDHLCFVENAALASRINSSLRSTELTIIKLSLRSSAVKAPTFQVPSSLMTEGGRPRSEVMMMIRPVSESSPIIIEYFPHIKIYRKNEKKLGTSVTNIFRS